MDTVSDCAAPELSLSLVSESTFITVFDSESVNSPTSDATLNLASDCVLDCVCSSWVAYSLLPKSNWIGFTTCLKLAPDWLPLVTSWGLTSKWSSGGLSNCNSRAAFNTGWVFRRPNGGVLVNCGFNGDGGTLGMWDEGVSNGTACDWLNSVLSLFGSCDFPVPCDLDWK